MTADTHNDTDESQRQYAKGKKSVSEDYVPYDSTGMTFSKRQNSDKKSGCSYQMLEAGSLWYNGHQERDFWMMELFYILSVVLVIPWIYTLFKVIELALARRLSWLEHRPRLQANCWSGHVPRLRLQPPSTYGRQLVAVSLSHRCFPLSPHPFHSLHSLHKSMNFSSGED